MQEMRRLWPPGTFWGKSFGSTRWAETRKRKYGIPRDNHLPIAESSSRPHEIYAYGFVNPGAMSFDSETGQLYVGDVGQNDIEEVDIVEKGRTRLADQEGTFLFDTTSGRAGRRLRLANSSE